MPQPPPTRFDASDEPPPPAPGVLEARARAWQMTGEPTALWPELDPRALQPAADAIGRAAAAVLSGSRASLGTAPDGRDAYAVGIAALLTGTGPLLGYWVERGLLDVSEPVARVLARHLAHGRRRAERMTSGALPALARLSADGIPPTVIKGFHTTHAYFPEPGLRPLADVDVLVLPRDVPRAEESLRAAGFATDTVVDRPYKRDFYPPDDDGRLWSLEMWHARDRWKLELHDGLNFGELVRYSVHLDAPGTAKVAWELRGVSLRMLPQPLSLVSLATHFVGELYVMRLLRLIELVLVVRRDRALGLLRWDEAEHVLRHSGTVRFAYPALVLAERLAPGTMDAGFLARARAAVPARMRAVMERFTPTSPILQDRVSLAERLMCASGPLDTLRRVFQFVVPQRVAGSPAGLRYYHRRLRRLLTGRVSWSVGGGGDDAGGGGGTTTS